MRIVGLTGGIACGKSFVADILSDLGALVIDADEVYHELLTRNELLTKIRQTFGDSFFLSDGALDRRSLGKFVFSDEKALNLLNSLTHPFVFREIHFQIDLATKAEPPLIVVVVPLLFEVGWEKDFDTIVVVSIPKELQTQRLMERSSLTEREALARIATQIPISEKMERADYVIDNSNERNMTKEYVTELFETLT